MILQKFQNEYGQGAGGIYNRSEEGKLGSKDDRPICCSLGVGIQGDAGKDLQYDSSTG